MAFSPASNDQRNFECITVTSVDFIKLPLKDILESHIKPVDLFKGINSCPALLSGKYKLRQDQLKLCFLQPPAIPDYSKFDVTLLYTLIRNLCPSLKPTKGWGKDPDDADIQIGDDIERLRLFRNNYHAHADSAAISDTDFKDIWKNLKSVVNRIQKNMYNKGRNVNFEQELSKIASSKIAQDHLESCKLLLEALINIQKQTNQKDEPEIFLKGEDRVCGDTARFEANARNVDFSCWQLIWQKRSGNSTECIDTNQEKYKGSANITLLIQNVSKEDEGEYQAVLSREANGIEYKITSNTVYLHALGELPILNDLRVTTGDEGITIHYNYKVLEQSPEVKHIHWCKNGEPLDRKSEKYIGGSLNENSLTITSPTDEDRGEYSCTITNAVGSISKVVIFGLPNITTSEETSIINKSVKLVGNVFVYDGSPDITEVFWTKNGEKIDTQGSGKRLSTVTVDDPSLTIRDVSHIDAGEYKLTARNAVGTTSSDIIVLGTPNVYLERLENEGSGSQSFRATIKATPSPCNVHWSKKGNDEDEFKPIDASAEEYRGTMNYLPHPELVIKQRNLLENNCFQIEVSNFVGSTVEKISDTGYQAELVCNFVSSPGPQRVLLDCCLHFLIHSLKNPNDTWTKDKIVTHVKRMISKLVEDNEKDRLEYFCQNLYQDESLSNTLLNCGEDFYSLIFSMEEKYNARNIMLSEGSVCVTFCFDYSLYLENYLKKLESKNGQLIKDLTRIILYKPLFKIFSISQQQIYWTSSTVKIYKGTQFFEKIFTYPIECSFEDCAIPEPEERSLLISRLLSTSRTVLDNMWMDLQNQESESEHHYLILEKLLGQSRHELQMRSHSEKPRYHRMFKEIFDKMEELGLEEGFYFQNIREKIRQYQKSLEEIEKLDTKVLEWSRLMSFLSTTKTFLDDMCTGLQRYGFQNFKQHWMTLGSLRHDMRLHPFNDELEECCRIEHVYYETSFEKIRQYRKSLEEIEELKTKDPEKNPETFPQKVHQMSLETLDKFGKLTEDVEKSHTKGEKILSQTQDPEEIPEKLTERPREDPEEIQEIPETLTEKPRQINLNALEEHWKSVKDKQKSEKKKKREKVKSC